MNTTQDAVPDAAALDDLELSLGQEPDELSQSAMRAIAALRAENEKLANLRVERHEYDAMKRDKEEALELWRKARATAAPTSEEAEQILLDLHARLAGVEEHRIDYLLVNTAALIRQQAREIARLQAAVATTIEEQAQTIADCNELHQNVERAEAERDALRADAERYRFWRRFYDCRFALKLAGTSLALSFRPARPDVEVSTEYEKLVDAALDAARQAAGEKV